MTSEEQLTWRTAGSHPDMPYPIPEPKIVGPTWRTNPEWDGKSQASKYELPKHTLGWQILAWIVANLRNDEGDPFAPTPEQSRFILWWYAVDEDGRFPYRQGVLQRIKGWLPGARTRWARS